MLDIFGAYELRDSYVRPDQLLLDPFNPRIVLLTRDEVESEPRRLADEQVQDYILSVVDKEEFHVADLIQSIRHDGYIPVGNKMIVEKVQGTDKYLVLEGNRRTAAIKHLLLNRHLLDPPVLQSIEKIPVQELLFTGKGKSSPDQVKFKILGLIHLTGALAWGPMERAYYIYKSYMSNLKEMKGNNSNFEYSIDCARDVAEFLKISIKKVRKDLAIFRIFEQLRRGKYNVKEDHYSLLDLSVGTNNLNVTYFGLSKRTLELSGTGLDLFARLCLDKNPPINNPQEFKAFVKIWRNGSEHELSLVESGEESVFAILERVKRRESRNHFLDQLMDIRHRLAELIPADFNETASEVKAIKDIQAIVNGRLCALIVDSSETEVAEDVQPAYPPKTIDEALRLNLDRFERPIRKILRHRPNYSCVRSKLPAYLLQEWQIFTRSGPREKFCVLVENAIGRLLAKGVLQAYKATNDRLRLLE